MGNFTPPTFSNFRTSSHHVLFKILQFGPRKVWQVRHVFTCIRLTLACTYWAVPPPLTESFIGTSSFSWAHLHLWARLPLHRHILPFMGTSSPSRAHLPLRFGQNVCKRFGQRFHQTFHVFGAPAVHSCQFDVGVASLQGATYVDGHPVLLMAMKT